ncbi:hypothetical protein BGW42_002766 [Actinomortierella wolfii]|nr:hypothetical protein BGW42_002766 [Actinomortierella wolfii]
MKTLWTALVGSAFLFVTSAAAINNTAPNAVKGPTDISKCKGEKGTIIAGQSFKGCKDDLCSDPKRALISANKANRVVIHTDGNLCVYGTRKGEYKNTWCSGKKMNKKQGPFSAVLHNNGDLCLYTKDGTNYWCSGSASTNNNQYRAIIQEDGNFVIYTAENIAIWNTGTGYGNYPFPYCK